MKNKIIALTAALSMLGGTVAALPAMAAERTLFTDDFNRAILSANTVRMMAICLGIIGTAQILNKK